MTDNAQSHDREAVMAAPLVPEARTSEAHGPEFHTFAMQRMHDGVYSASFTNAKGEVCGGNGETEQDAVVRAFRMLRFRDTQLRASTL